MTTASAPIASRTEIEAATKFSRIAALQLIILLDRPPPAEQRFAAVMLVCFSSIHRVIPKALVRFCTFALTCGLQTKDYHDFQILAFGSAGCGDRQGRIDLDVARYRRRIMWKIRSWFRAAGSSARNVTGGRKLARHDSGRYLLAG
jgi:hypothetical protein